jgi:hypothetical protein
MGELLDKLNASDNAKAFTKSAANQGADFFRAASQKVDTVVESIREPNMPMDKISRWTRQAPLASARGCILTWRDVGAAPLSDDVLSPRKRSRSLSLLKPLGRAGAITLAALRD